MTLWRLLESGLFLSPPGTPKNVQHEEVLIEERHVFSLSRKPAKASLWNKRNKKARTLFQALLACQGACLPTIPTFSSVLASVTRQRHGCMSPTRLSFFFFLFFFSSVAVVYCKALQCLLFTIAPIFACIHCSLPHHLVFVSQF